MNAQNTCIYIDNNNTFYQQVHLEIKRGGKCSLHEGDRKYRTFSKLTSTTHLPQFLKHSDSPETVYMLTSSKTLNMWEKLYQAKSCGGTARSLKSVLSSFIYFQPPDKSAYVKNCCLKYPGKLKFKKKLCFVTYDKYSYFIEVFCGTSKEISRPPAEVLELAFPQATSGVI